MLAPVLTTSVPSCELTCPEKFPSMRRDDLKVTSPANFTTSPTKPSQLSLGIFFRWSRSRVVATAWPLTGFPLSVVCLRKLSTCGDVEVSRCPHPASGGDNPELTATIASGRSSEVTIRLRSQRAGEPAFVRISQPAEIISKGIFVSAKTCQSATRPSFTVAFQATGKRQLLSAAPLNEPPANPHRAKSFSFSKISVTSIE